MTAHGEKPMTVDTHPLTYAAHYSGTRPTTRGPDQRSITMGPDHLAHLQDPFIRAHPSREIEREPSEDVRHLLAELQSASKRP